LQTSQKFINKGLVNSWKQFRKPKASRSFSPIEDDKAKEKEEKVEADLVL
jgi:hypothetical protein